jgi:hypothetical protein
MNGGDYLPGLDSLAAMESLLVQFAPKLCGIVTTLVIPLLQEDGEAVQRALANHTSSFGKTASALPAPHRAAANPECSRDLALRNSLPHQLHD